MTAEAIDSLDGALVSETGKILQASRFLARQPILNLRGDVIGYELLFRMGWESCFRGETDEATRKTFDHLLYVGSESLAKNELAFVNCTREALVERLVTLLPVKTTVLEILETVEPDAELIQACTELRSLGYRLALDDFVPRPEMYPLVELASYIKVDFQLSDLAQRQEICQMTRGGTAALLAEKVENQEEYDQARSEGYQYFQGFYFCRPKIIANREIPSNRMNYVRLMVELTRKTLHRPSLVRIVSEEASLCFRLLRLANSPLLGVRTSVTSVEDALLLVGEDRFRTLVSVAASCALSENQPVALISLSLERARFCELLAPLLGESPTEQFMLGMLSLLDTMLGISMESIVESLPLRAEAKDALMGAANPAALPLCLIRSFESGSWADCEGTSKAPVSEEKLARLYVESVEWAKATLASSR